MGERRSASAGLTWTDRRRRRWWAGLRARLLVAFLAVAVAAVALLAGMTLLAARSEVAGLVERQRQAAAAGVVDELARAYADAGSWQRADLRGVQVLLIDAQAALELRDADGTAVSAPALAMANMMAEMHAPPLGSPREHAVHVDGEPVGTASLRFPAEGLPEPERQLRAALTRTVTIAGVFAALLAAVVAVAVTRRVTRPLQVITEAVRRFQRGEADARASQSTEIAELAELAAAFDRMADTLVRREQQRQALAADVAHELRTPLSVLQGSLEALADGTASLDGEQLESLHEEVQRLGRMVEDLETLSAAEAAELTIRRVPVDLGRLANETAAAHRSHFDAAGLGLRVDTAPVTVVGDAGRLQQVIANLLANAAKFTPAGGRVTVSVRARDRQAELRVADTGPGVPPEERTRIFERFWRGRHAAGTGGSGIGLAVVAEITRAHDGTVGVDETADGGAAFTVRLPVHPGRAVGLRTPQDLHTAFTPRPCLRATLDSSWNADQGGPAMSTLTRAAAAVGTGLVLLGAGWGLGRGDAQAASHDEARDDMDAMIELCLQHMEEMGSMMDGMTSMMESMRGMGGMMGGAPGRGPMMDGMDSMPPMGGGMRGMGPMMGGSGG